MAAQEIVRVRTFWPRTYSRLVNSPQIERKRFPTKTGTQNTLHFMTPRGETWGAARAAGVLEGCHASLVVVRSNSGHHAREGRCPSKQQWYRKASRLGQVGRLDCNTITAVCWVVLYVQLTRTHVAVFPKVLQRGECLLHDAKGTQCPPLPIIDSTYDT